MSELPFDLIRSRRKTFSVQIRDGRVIVRAPMSTTKEQAAAFVNRHRQWVLKHLEKERRILEDSRGIPPLTEQELQALSESARRVIPGRVRHYAPLVGVTYGKITIRAQRSRWGSCSAAGNLNFNCLLMLMPLSVLDSIVVHELCHRKHMNHSQSFYREVLRVYPNYHECQKWLKTNGRALLRRLP